MKLRFSAEATDGLRQIGDYIAKDDPARALAFVQDLREKCREICEMPLRFPLVRGLETRGVRRRVAGRYLIFYRVDADAVDIIHILHGARDHEAWLDQL